MNGDEKRVAADALRTFARDVLAALGQPCSVSPAATRLLAGLPIKMLGVQNVAAPNGLHEVFLGQEPPIPIIEEMVNLDQVTKERVFFIGLPLRVAEMDSSWIRAVAFEPRE